MTAARAFAARTSPLVAGGALVVLAAGAKAAAAVLIPVVLAWFLAVLCLPLLAALSRRGVPRGLAVLVVLAVCFALLSGFLVLLLGSLSEFAEAGPRYAAEMRERLAYTLDWWREKGILVEAWMPDRWVDSERLVAWIGGAVRQFATLLSEGLLVLLTLIFILLEAADFRAKLRRAFGDDPRLERLERVTGELQRYLGIKTAMSALLGLCTGLLAFWLGIDFPVLLGLLAFACHFIPNVGALLAALPAMLLAFVQFDLVKVGAVGLGYAALATVLGNLLEPWLMGRRLGLSTLVVFLSLIFWGWLWGPVGMLLSVPLTLTFKIVAEAEPSLTWLAVLLDAEAPPDERVAGVEAALPPRPAAD